ncbi:MAG TPA: FAD-dependent oxidoreductase [Acidimicrobiales bacterium]|nr:FAD-dependent oxidoreductase [Acidimicrobiales bacterium]
MSRSIAVIGAGLAGLRACEGLRDRGFDGTITLVGEESHWPYDRPPLSKQFLAGEWDLHHVVLRPPDKLDELDVDLRLGQQWRAVGLDAAAKTVSLAGGESISADGLVLCTGSAARRLTDLDGLAGVHVLRTLDDSLALREALQPGAHLGLVGAGFIGLEVAATARRLGVEVTVVEPLSVPLGRALGPVGGGACEMMHRQEGVKFHLGTSVESAEASATAGGGLRCRLSDGSTLEVDALLVGIGAAPSVDWLQGSGLAVGPGGVEVDRDLLAAPGIAVAGDLARWQYPTGTRVESVRVEHRTNAAEQGDFAAGALLRSLGWLEAATSRDEDRLYEVPYVWSDQYKVKIQILGMPGPDDDVEVVEGTPQERRFVALYGRGGELRGCVGFSRPRHVMSLRSLFERHASLEEAKALF